MTRPVSASWQARLVRPHAPRLLRPRSRVPDPPPPIGFCSSNEPAFAGGYMPLPRSCQTFAEFDRDYLRETNRLGMSIEDLIDEPAFDADLDFESDDDEDDEY